MWTADLKDGVAGFQLLNDTDDPAYLPLIVAIGYRGNEAIGVAMREDVEVAPGESAYWRLIMSDAPIIDPQGRAPDGTYRVLTWKTGDLTMPSCVLIEHGPDRFVISPEGDNDCDEVMANPECAPWSYRAQDRPGTIATATCAMDVPLMPGVGACLAMGPLCNEALPSPTPSCSRIDEDYCLATPICQCAGAGWNSTCLTNNTAPVASYIDCVVPVTDGYLPCQSTVSFDMLDVQSFVAATATHVDNVRVHELAATIGPFDSRADVTSNIKLEVESFDAPHVIFRWSGPTSTAMTSGQPLLASLDLDNDRHIVLPLLVRYEPSCTSRATCLLKDTPGDDVKACAEVTDPTPSCAPSSNCTTGGVYCGTECCLPGEQCTATGCLCAGIQRCPQDYICTNNIVNGCGDSCCMTGAPNTCLF